MFRPASGDGAAEMECLDGSADLAAMAGSGSLQVGAGHGGGSFVLCCAGCPPGSMQLQLAGVAAHPSAAPVHGHHQPANTMRFLLPLVASNRSCLP